MNLDSVQKLFINKLKTIYPPNIQLTFEIGKLSVEYLNLKISKNFEDNSLSLSLFEKKGNKYAYPFARSNHPPSSLKGILFTLLNSYVICNSNEENYEICKRKCIERLLDRGYSEYFIRKSKKPRLFVLLSHSVTVGVCLCLFFCRCFCFCFRNTLESVSLRISVVLYVS